MLHLLHTTFLNNLNETIVLQYGKKKLVKTINKCDSVLFNIQYLAIKKVFRMANDQKLLQNTQTTQSVQTTQTVQFVDYASAKPKQIFASNIL